VLVETRRRSRASRRGPMPRPRRSSSATSEYDVRLVLIYTESRQQAAGVKQVQETERRCNTYDEEHLYPIK